MRWQYRIRLANGKTATCSSNEPIFHPLDYFRQKFGDSFKAVHKRFGDGPWTLCTRPKEVVPQCPEEAESVAAITEEPMQFEPQTEETRQMIGKWLDGALGARTRTLARHPECLGHRPPVPTQSARTLPKVWRARPFPLGR